MLGLEADPGRETQVHASVCRSGFLMALPSWAPYGAAAEPQAASGEQGCSHTE